VVLSLTNIDQLKANNFICFTFTKEKQTCIARIGTPTKDKGQATILAPISPSSAGLNMWLFCHHLLTCLPCRTSHLEAFITDKVLWLLTFFTPKKKNCGAKCQPISSNPKACIIVFPFGQQKSSGAGDVSTPRHTCPSHAPPRLYLPTPPQPQGVQIISRGPAADAHLQIILLLSSS
jgi:hypothetical protein